MSEDVQPISSSRLVPSEVARHSFGTVRRGFDPQEVRAFLELVARELNAWDHHDQDLRRQLAEAEERSLHPVIDEATLTTALGQQSAQVLRDAHEESARITREAEEAAAALVREAQSHAAELQVQAESAVAERMAQADIATGSVHQEAEQDAVRILETARSEAEAVVAQARLQCQAMVEQAQETRRRVLADMAQRRHAMTVQIEQFRAARDELSASVQEVRHAVDRIVDGLDRADDSARAAAAEVARRQSPRASDSEIAAEVERVSTELDAGGGPQIGDEVPGGTGAVAEAPAGLTADGVPGDRGQATEPATPPVEPATLPVEPVTPGAVTGAPTVEPATTGAVTGAPTVETVAAPASAPAPYGDEPSPGRATDPFAAAVPAHVDEEQGQASGEARADAVEGLFARLRAGQPHPPDAATTETHEADDQVPAEEGAEDAGGDAAGEGAPETGDGETDDPDGPARARWAELLDPVAVLLARRVKRALQDDQNALLDRLRNSSDSWSDAMLAPEDEQRARYVEAATPALHDAAAAGIAMAREVRSSRGRVPSPDARAVAEAAESLAGTVVTLLRRRLTDDARDSGSPVDRVGAAFREWRGERIERLVGDCALAAFSSGILVASGKGSGLRWLVGGSGPPCADCDDNSLAGAVAPGDEFPTGHRYPPAHAGCRCMVVPTPG
jgi:DivIVA domain-containing protein